MPRRVGRLVSRIEVEPLDGRLRVASADGAVLAESERALVLHERGHRDRYYLPLDDVQVHAEPNPKSTTCPFKGRASYFDVGGHEAIAWSYAQPKAGVEEIRGLVAFYDERLKLEIVRGSS